MIIPPILSTSFIHFSLGRLGECTQNVGVKVLCKSPRPRASVNEMQTRPWGLGMRCKHHLRRVEIINKSQASDANTQTANRRVEVKGFLKPYPGQHKLVQEMGLVKKRLQRTEWFVSLYLTNEQRGSRIAFCDERLTASSVRVGRGGELLLFSLGKSGFIQRTGTPVSTAFNKVAFAMKRLVGSCSKLATWPDWITTVRCSQGIAFSVIANSNRTIEVLCSHSPDRTYNVHAHEGVEWVTSLWQPTCEGMKEWIRDPSVRMFTVHQLPGERHGCSKTARAVRRKKTGSPDAFEQSLVCKSLLQGNSGAGGARRGQAHREGRSGNQPGQG